MAVRCVAKPWTRAAIDCAIALQSTTSKTGKSEILGKIGGRAVAALRAVEQAHDAFDDDEIGVLCRAGASNGPRFRASSPRDRD